jgi:hypothetical protein
MWSNFFNLVLRNVGDDKSDGERKGRADKTFTPKRCFDISRESFIFFCLKTEKF